MSATEDSERLAKDLEAIIAARSDLDKSYEPALVEAFLERVDEAIEKRVEAEVDAREPEGYDKDLAISSMGIGIPITVVAGIFGDVYGIAIAWAGIVGVNLAAALGARRKRRR